MGGGKGSDPGAAGIDQQAEYYRAMLDQQQGMMDMQKAQYLKQFEQQQANSANMAKEREAQRVASGIEGRDALYSGYMNAAGQATDYVNAEIKQEQANAAMLGIDYNITDEQKSQRVNDYFATMWGEGDQQRLEASFAEWGNPEGFTNFTVKRGDGGKYGKGSEGKEEVVGSTEGNWDPNTLRSGGAGSVSDDEDDTLGAKKSILGA